DGPGHRSHNRADQDVAIANVTEFMGQYALNLLVVADFHDAARYGHGSMAGIAPGSESVRRVRRNHVDFAVGNIGFGSQPLDDLVDPGIFLTRDSLRAARRQG